mmetsp:Transcript_32422/g.30926  ORF Transcript_32422/g.30926 Transcript_32422/m.30926 type:complete len:333 (+) Transcript_32422:178-1176(+)
MYLHPIFHVASFILNIRICVAVNNCRDNEHRNGSWIKDETIKSKNYHCCGHDSHDHRHNIEVCGGINLKGLYNYYGSNDHRMQVGGSGCTCDAKYGRSTVSSRESYKWTPHSCTMIMFNATHFCSLIGNRTIYLHGDSTMDQAANSLISQIYTQKAGCAQRIFFYREFSNNLYPGLFQRMRTVNTSIAIFSFGAHAHNDESIRDFWKFFNNTIHLPQMKALQNKNNITYVWRTNHPAHVNCQQAIEPSNITIDTFPQYNDSIDPYNWSGFSRWDFQSIENARSMNMKILDMSPLYSRIDSHPVNGDCLHYCLPGPIDIFATILYQMLYNNEI